MNSFWKVTAVSALVLGLAACADSRTAQRATPPGPGDFGAFAYDDGQLHRLSTSSKHAAQGVSAWSDKVSLGPDVRFVVQDPALTFGTADLEQRIRLVRVYHSRDVAYDAPGERSGSLPEWLVIDAAPTQAVPVAYDTYGPMATDSETGQYARVIEVIPRKPLTPGMYALYVSGQETSQLARFGVDWTEADKVAFDNTSCVTSVVASDVSYGPCPSGVAWIGHTSWVGAATTGTSTAAALVPVDEGLED